MNHFDILTIFAMFDKLLYLNIDKTYFWLDNFHRPTRNISQMSLIIYYFKLTEEVRRPSQDALTGNRYTF
jgi:hypothetical protein